MGYYSSFEDMFKARAEKQKKIADRHWGKAKSGQGGWHYAKAKASYDSAAHNRKQAAASSK